MVDWIGDDIVLQNITAQFLTSSAKFRNTLKFAFFYPRNMALKYIYVKTY